jgi:iron complex outermembrane receptor protein
MQQSTARADTTSSGIQDIVVTARRTAENLQKVPLSITAFTPARLRDLSLRNVPDVAKQTPGLITNQSPNDPSGGTIFIRGLGAPDVLINLEPAVAVYVDGIYLPQSIGLSAALVDVQRVEVLKGPQGTLYGKNTTGGALTITSRAPDLENVNGYIDGRLGNYSLREITAAISLPIVEDKLAVRFAGQHTEHGGYGHDANDAPLNAVNNDTVRGRLTWHPDDRLTVDLIGDYTDVDNSGVAVRPSSVTADPTGFGIIETAAELGLNPANLADLLTARNALASYIGKGGFYDDLSNSPQASKSRAYGVSGTIAYDLSDDLKFKSISGERWLSRHTLEDIDGTPFNILYANQISKDRVFSQEGQFIGRTGSLNWIAGGYYARAVGFDNTKAYSLLALNPLNPTGFFEDALDRTFGIYGQGTYAVTSTVNLTGGLRYTWDHREAIAHNYNATGCTLDPSFNVDLPDGCSSPTLSRQDHGLSYLASVDWHFAPSMMVYVKTSRGFRGGGLNVRSSTAATNPSFEPEQATDYEIGTKLDLFDRHLRIDGALFHTRLKNAQESVIQVFGDPPATVTAIENAATAIIKGFELEATVVPFDGLTINGSIGYVDARFKHFEDVTGDRSGEKFPVPKVNYSGTVTYSLPIGTDKLTFVANVAGRSSQSFYAPVTDVASVTQKSYAILTGRIAYTIAAIDADVAVFATNITAKKYLAFADAYDKIGLGFNTVYPGEPRTFGVELTKRFGPQ